MGTPPILSSCVLRDAVSAHGMWGACSPCVGSGLETLPSHCQSQGPFQVLRVWGPAPSSPVLTGRWPQTFASGKLTSGEDWDSGGVQGVLAPQWPSLVWLLRVLSVSFRKLGEAVLLCPSDL